MEVNPKALSRKLSQLRSQRVNARGRRRSTYLHDLDLPNQPLPIRLWRVRAYHLNHAAYLCDQPARPMRAALKPWQYRTWFLD